LKYYTGYSERDIMPCVRELNALVKAQENGKFKSIYKKFSNPKLLNVALLPTWDGVS
jgi:hypothetical protein